MSAKPSARLRCVGTNPSGELAHPRGVHRPDDLRTVEGFSEATKTQKSLKCRNWARRERAPRFAGDEN